MTVQGWFQIVLFFVVLTALTPLIGGYMARVFGGERVFLTPVLGPVERLFYRLMRTDPEREQDWKGYARTVIVFNLLSFLALYLILRTQGIHPFNPQGFHSGTWDVSFNTAASFVTNTNWQFYAGETTLSNFSQMAGLTVQNFVSAAVGIAVLVAVIRGFSRRSGKTLGNFWADLIRSLLYVLLPISLIGAFVLVSQGVIQTLGANIDFTTLTGAKSTLAVGPVASAASSTSTRRCRSRTRTGSRTSSSCC
jgi:potassium-transporting ATPase potassium-binding subunit